jgi:hypothetical protein
MFVIHVRTLTEKNIDTSAFFNLQRFGTDVIFVQVQFRRVIAVTHSRQRSSRFTPATQHQP